MESKRSHLQFQSTKKFQSAIQFKRSALAAFVMAASAGALAQEDPEVEEEIIVHGIRANIAEAADIKRSADTHVDAISAKDIGSLPDISVLEAVQRVPGISIERFAAADDPDHYSVEGSGLTLRGLPQTRSEFNGRDAFSAGNTQGLTFQDVSPELMGSVQVIKNHTADMVEGGISGTVNLVTRKPFDSGDLEAVASVIGNYSDHRYESATSFQNFTPSFSGLISNVWELESGARIGALLSHADAEFEFRTDGFEAGEWHETAVTIDGESATRWAPGSAGIRTSDIDRERDATSFVLQYGNANDTLEATFEYFQSNSTQEWREIALYDDEQVLTPGGDAVFNGTSLVSGTLENIVSPETWSNIDKGHNSQRRRNNIQSKIEDFSLNIDWKPSDELTLIFDAQYVDAAKTATDLSVFGGIAADAFVDFSSDLPQVTYIAPGVDIDDDEANRAYFSDPANYYHQAAMDHLEDSDGNETALKLEAIYEFDSDFIDSVHSGVRYAEREQNTRWSNYNWKAVSEAWHGDSSRTYFDGAIDTNSWDGSADRVIGGFLDEVPDVSTNDLDRFFRGRGDSGIAGGTFLSAGESAVESYQAFLDYTSATENSGGFESLAERPGEIVNDFYLRPEINPINEEFTAAFIRINFSDSSDRLIGNLGFRYVSQDISSSGGNLYPTFDATSQAAILAENDLVADWGFTQAEVDALTLATPDDLAFADGGTQLLTSSSSFSTVLPSLNLRYEINDDMYVRFAASQSIAFADTGLYRYAFLIDWDNDDLIRESDAASFVLDDGVDANSTQALAVDISDGLTANAGNPFIEPMESINLDLSWEWYFGEGNSLAAGVFHKDIKNFFATSATEQQFTNNGVTRAVDVFGPVNTGDGTLQGLEFSYNQFWSNGLGVQFNYTYLQEDNVPNQNTREVEATGVANSTSTAFEGLPLEGLSEHTYNLSAVYEKNSLRARLAYNYRSEYLLTQKQVNLGLPIYSAEVGVLDGSIFYDVNDNFEVGFTVNNILDDIVETTMQVNEEGLQLPRTHFISDRRMALVLRVRL